MSAEFREKGRIVGGYAHNCASHQAYTQQGEPFCWKCRDIVAQYLMGSRFPLKVVRDAAQNCQNALVFTLEA